MAWTNVTYACGDDVREQLTGPQWQRERYIEQASRKLCPTHYKEKIAEERAKASGSAALAAQDRGLPALQGSEKQVTWAETIREKYASQLDTLKGLLFKTQATPERLELYQEGVGYAENCLQEKDQAKWWIDTAQNVEAKDFVTTYFYRQAGRGTPSLQHREVISGINFNLSAAEALVKRGGNLAQLEAEAEAAEDREEAEAKAREDAERSRLAREASARQRAADEERRTREEAARAAQLAREEEQREEARRQEEASAREAAQLAALAPAPAILLAPTPRPKRTPKPPAAPTPAPALLVDAPRRSRGRPPGSLSAPPSQVVGVRLYLWTLEPLEAAALGEGLPVSVYIEQLLEAKAKRLGGKEPPKPKNKKLTNKSERKVRKAPERKSKECAPDAPCSYLVEGGRCTVPAMVVVPAKGGSIGIERINARFCVVEIEQLLTSHKPLGGFGPRAGYPPDAQERDYLLQSEQGKVLKIAQDYEPAMIFSTAPGALDGLPVVTEDRFVLGGNGRAMATMLVYDDPKTAHIPRDYLIDHARQFGLTKADVRKFKHPMVVRTIRAGGSDARTLAEWSRRLNAALSQQLDPIALAVSRAKFISPQLLERLSTIGDNETLPEFLSTDRSLDFVKALQTSGVIDSRSGGLYLNKRGLLTDDGRALVVDLLVARIVPNAREIHALGPGAIATISRSAYFLIATEALGPYNLLPALRGAVADRLTMKSQENTNLQNFLKQPLLFSSRTPLHSMMLQIFFQLEDAPVRFMRVFRRYLQLAKKAGQGQSGLFGTQTPQEALQEAAREANLNIKP